jgi:DNA-directed RNA polymerase specialized sigma24 family protein
MYQELLRWRFWNRLSFTQIGELMGISSDAVRHGYYRAIDLLSGLIHDPEE